MQIDERLIQWQPVDSEENKKKARIDERMVKWEPVKESGFIQNLVSGAARGAGSIGATLLAPIDAAARAVGVSNDFIGRNDRRAAMDAALSGLGADTDSWAYKGGKIASEIAGTAGVGGALAGGARLAAPALATKAAPLIESIASGGFNVGGMSGIPAIATRAVGGAINGAAAAGLVNPEDAAAGASIGAVMPGAVQAIGTVGRGVGNAYRSMRTPEVVKMAEKLAASTGRPLDEVLSVLEQQGPQLLPGYRATVPQLLQTPELSQLQRSLKTVGTNAIGDAERAQQQAMRAGLERIAPIDNTVNDAATRAGDAIQRYYGSARKAAGDRVTRSFEAVDPFGETSINLPLDAMRSAKAKFLGPGTFGAGGDVDKAIQTAESVGLDVLDAIKPAKQIVGQDVAKAVRSAGGIRGTGGELRDLGIKQSGTTGIVNNKSGRALDLMAEDMANRGFIKNADPDELLSALSDSIGKRGRSFGYDVPEEVLQGAFESAMGDAPGAMTLAKGVPFQTMQNLRSSIGDAAERAGRAGNNQERAALRGMVAAIDDKINSVAGGAKDVGEYFPQDIASQYREALKMHADKKLQFDTGPQYLMGRKGADGLPAVEGAEIPGKFFSSRASQVQDMQAFKTLVKDKPALMDDMKRFAITEAAATGNVSGDLTSKYLKWMESRSGAAKELFSPGELATLKEVGNAVERQIKTEGLGRVTGSDTAQKLASIQSLGLLDSPAVDMLARKIPIVGSFTGPALDGLRQNAAKSRNELVAGLLSSPEAMAAALRKVRRPGSNLLDDVMELAMPLTSRAVPVGLLGL